jgi:7-carboxy-7-deazaguanine synthase
VSRAGLLPVAELFGPTFQCEGPSCGQRASFLRLSRCNLACSWCDTPYTWDTSRFDLREETTWKDPDDVVAELLAIDAPIVVVSGGEPLLHQERLRPVFAALRAAGRRIEIATNGTVTPDDTCVELVDHFEVSPKLANAGMTPERRIRPDTLRSFAGCGHAVFKFVVETVDELAEIDGLAPLLAPAPIWISPQAVTVDGVVGTMQQLADPVLERGWNLTTRMHILMWGDVRGR